MSEDSATVRVIDEPTEEIIQPRTLETWLPEEQKVINRAVRLFVSRGVSLDLHCTNPECEDNAIKRAIGPGGFFLICACKRRAFNRPTQKAPRF